MIKICENENCENEIINMRSDARYCSKYCNNNQKHLTKMNEKLNIIIICKNRDCFKVVKKGTKFCSKECISHEKHCKNMEKDLLSRPFKKCKYNNCIKDISKMKKDILYCCKEHRLMENKEKTKEVAKLWYENNKEIAKSSRKKYYNINKEKLIKGQIISQRIRRENPIIKLQNSISCRIRRVLKNNSLYKNGKTKDILGCSYEEFKLYIEYRFENWMTWDNYGKYNGVFNYGWDIDHIIPVSSCKSEEDILRLNHYTNLQPLCSKINRDIKKDKLIYPL